MAYSLIRVWVSAADDSAKSRAVMSSLKMMEKANPAALQAAWNSHHLFMYRDVDALTLSEWIRRQEGE